VVDYEKFPEESFYQRSRIDVWRRDGLFPDVDRDSDILRRPDGRVACKIGIDQR
jgi:hypothetical protein